MAKTRCLLVDDNCSILELLAYLLDEIEDVEVVGLARDGCEAVEETKRLRPDAVIMDISMPKMDGIDATRSIRSQFPDTRVIGFSMSDDPDTTRKMLKAGAVSCLSKNSSWHSALSSIRQALLLKPKAVMTSAA